MSRIGKAPITVPSGVDVTIAGRTVTVKGPKGTLARDIPGEIVVRKEDTTIFVERPNDERQNRALHGLSRTLVNNRTDEAKMMGTTPAWLTFNGMYVLCPPVMLRPTTRFAN